MIVIYRCQNCGRSFSEPACFQERHGLSAPPYERRTVCPYCSEDDAVEIAAYCRCCGARMNRAGLYCCDACRRRAGVIWENEKKRKQAEEPINRVLRRKEDYNRRHGTAYSYGQFVALCLGKRKTKQNTREETNHV